LWELVAPKCPATEFRELLWERSPDAVTWVKVVDTFTLSTALMSMAGYVIGLGDRHPSNIMILRQTGHVVHIDFGESFERTLNRDRMPEKVPFRLTRMIVNAFGVSGIEGRFRQACEDIMRVLRDNTSSIIAQLEIFVHEPIFVNADNGTYGEGKSSILDRVIAKLGGKDPVIYGEECKEKTVEDQVDLLIQIAADPVRYVNHFCGWCPFW
jgi:phosphatidylinositol kinase/protein kinase (PI-3  family)